MDESLPGDLWGSHRRTFSPRVPVAAGVRGPSVGNAGAAIALCCALHSNSFGLPNNQLKSFPCVFFTKEVLQSQKYIFRRGDCVFSPPSGQHPSTEGKKSSEWSSGPASGDADSLECSGGLVVPLCHLYFK